MVQMFFRAKRRLKQEWKGLKYIFSSDEGKKIIKTTYIMVESIKVIYNPWYLFDIIFRHKLIKNL
tara:strand:+ start:9951 stop:10145 length:195 start_codon:yes stop_codon:yes gene_type:complete